MNHWFWCAAGVIGVIALMIFLKFFFGLIRNLASRKKLERWSRLTKNSSVLIVHCPPNAKTIPSPSPFVMKLLTYLRMTGIPHELDHKDPFGGKGKTPWISYNGENISDSEFILNFLVNKFGQTLKMSYGEDELAVATAVRIMADEHLVWGMVLERFVLGSAENMLQVFHLPGLMRLIAKRVILGRAKNQGIGAHEQEDIVRIISKDIQTISRILGSKRYILGYEPCIEDAGIFGQLSQFYWGLPNNPYETLLNGECKNLREYCFRMREEFWPDWK